MDSVAALDGDLPQYDDFIDYNGKNLLDLEHQEFMQYHEHAKNSDKARTAEMLGRPEPPTGEQVYEEHRREWERRGFATLGDLLR